MKRIRLVTALFIIPALLAAAQTNSSPPLEILSFKIVSYYNPLLERSAVSADARELPRTPAERIASAQRTTPRSPQERANEVGIPPGAAPTIKTVKTIGAAEWVYFTIKNTSAQPIKTLSWDFTFLRLEQGKLLLRHSVTSQAEIKPGAKKTFRQPLPPGATRCKVVNVRETAAPEGRAKTEEFVCGRGFSDPSLLREKLEPVVIQRIEYADGSVWCRTDSPQTRE